MKISILLFALMISLSSIVSRPHSGCDCEAVSVFYLKGEEVYRISADANIATWIKSTPANKIKFRGVKFRYDSLSIHPAIKY